MKVKKFTFACLKNRLDEQNIIHIIINVSIFSEYNFFSKLSMGIC